MKNLIVFLFAVCALQAYAGGGSSIGPASPASLNCVKLGGALKLMTSPTGQWGLCGVEEWKLFRFMNQCRLVQVHHYSGMVPNPASQNCADVGGQIQIARGPQGEYGICAIEEWKLFRSVDADKCLQR